MVVLVVDIIREIIHKCCTEGPFGNMYLVKRAFVSYNLQGDTMSYIGAHYNEESPIRKET
jgi:hypothetical protein